VIQGLTAIDGAGTLARTMREASSTVGLPSAGVQLETSFAQALSDATTRAVGTMKGAEAMSISALQGDNVNVRDVVDSVMSAEQTLQSAISIRDKIVQAYLEVSRMAI
jgi:flagellar hook-basal body complex protein FliE